MKKIIWVCVASLLVFIIGACARMGKDPEGLVKKNKEEISDKEADSFLANEDSGNDLQEDNKVTQQNVSLYFLDKENNDLVCETRNIMIPDATVVFDEIISSLIRGPQSDDLQPVISKSTKVVGAEKTDNVLKVDLSKDFLESEDLIIARTALVNTLTQLEDVEYVKIDIEGQELTRDGTEDGDIFGVLSKSTNNVDELIATESRKDGLKEVSRELFFSDCGEKYLLSEIRPIKVIDGQVAKAIVEELIKGPINASEGLYSVIPKGTQLLDVELIEEGESNIVALYFSKEFKAAFKDPEETPEETENREAMVLSSIVYSLKELPKVKGIKIYYENSYGNYTDIPLHKIDLKKPLNTRDFPGKLGRKLKIYFANTGSTHLVPNYRSSQP